ncbi:hypothetical protein [Enterococcus caccae]|uniref:Uncharacterized protein n=1 Tax=Enterococcus caccae ATCC BAA-1240 TaxID=1158612 RepID=R3TP87_9ENTE|nr:hypothetical protein [Enterococcus caccae]EOL43344.1 hypothetical protein UC7_02673 [Enterococcus caccae ATCC BAA-1240]EOT68256.1 hypothetical protein I580_00639 [Enterococcus caccae ATCC BAA-1240]OJG26742.1 hypothetical protein RU98_GL003129 [Enterococcus caccae]
MNDHDTIWGYNGRQGITIYRYAGGNNSSAVKLNPQPAKRRYGHRVDGS